MEQRKELYRRTNQKWTEKELRHLLKEVHNKKDKEQIARDHGRTKAAIITKINELGWSSSYNSIPEAIPSQFIQPWNVPEEEAWEHARRYTRKSDSISSDVFEDTPSEFEEPSPEEPSTEEPFDQEKRPSNHGSGLLMEVSPEIEEDFQQVLGGLNTLIQKRISQDSFVNTNLKDLLHSQNDIQAKLSVVHDLLWVVLCILLAVFCAVVIVAMWVYLAV